MLSLAACALCAEGAEQSAIDLTDATESELPADAPRIYDHNNRPAQALNDRVLYLDHKPTVTIH